MASNNKLWTNSNPTTPGATRKNVNAPSENTARNLKSDKGVANKPVGGGNTISKTGLLGRRLSGTAANASNKASDNDFSKNTYRIQGPKGSKNPQMDEITVSMILGDSQSAGDSFGQDLENRYGMDGDPRFSGRAQSAGRKPLTSANVPSSKSQTTPRMSMANKTPNAPKPLKSHGAPSSSRPRLLSVSESAQAPGPQFVKPVPQKPPLQTYRSQPNLLSLSGQTPANDLRTSPTHLASNQNTTMNRGASPLHPSWTNASPRVSPWLTKQLHHEGDLQYHPYEETLQQQQLSRSTPFLEDMNQDTHTRKFGHRNVATDTFELDRIRNEEIRQLQDRIDDLECENKVKEREIGTNRWIEKEMQRHLKTTEELMDLKSQMRETERQLGVQQRINKQLMDENGRLFDEISEKDRFIRQLQTEVDNLDKIISNKASLNEGEIIQRLQSELDQSHFERDRLAQSLALGDQELLQFQKELEQKSREVKFKNDEILNLQKQIFELQNAVEDLDRERTLNQETIKLSEREKHLLQEQVAKVLDVKAMNMKLARENGELRDEIQAMESKCRLLEGDREEKSRLKDLVDEMKIMLGDKKLAEKENENLASQLSDMEALLKDKGVEEEALHHEVSQLKHFCQQLEKENSFYRDYENRYHKEKQAHDVTNQEKEYLQSKLDQLQPKLAHLLEQSREKDRVMSKLMAELTTRGDFLMPSLVADISRATAPLPTTIKGRPYRGMSEKTDEYPTYSARTPDSRQHTSPQKTLDYPQYLSEFSPTKKEAPGLPYQRNGESFYPTNMDGGYETGPTSTPTESQQNLNPNRYNRTPDAPMNFVVKRMGEKSIMMQWVAPTMDDLDCNNGEQLSGYKIYMNNVEQQSIGSPRLTKTYINGLHVEDDTVFAIETVASSNVRSQRVETTINDSNKQGTDYSHVIGGENWSLQAATPHPATGNVDFDFPINGSSNNLDNYQQGRAQLVQVTSDFTPSQDTLTQLAVKSGDKVKIIGKVKSDGYVLIEKQGKKGFVPAKNLKNIS